MKISIKNIFVIISLIFTTFCSPADAVAAESAQQLLIRTVTRISKAGGLQASFRMSGGASASGQIYSQGKMFAVISNSASSWYDGKSLWTYNPSTKETTLVTPTAAELGEANPLSFLGAHSQFTASYAKSSPAGTKTLILSPKSKKTGVKSLQITLNASTLLPSRVVMTPFSGGPVTLTISNVVVGKKFPASTFKYPSVKYPKVKIIDLR